MAELAPGVLVRHVAAGPFEGLGKNDLPSQLCAFTAGVLRAEARHEPGYYDVVHSHYWLSGQVGWLARDRWGVPLVHSAHTLARVKNAALADGDQPEPMVRVIGEDQVVAEADRLIGNTDEEARQLVELYGADPSRTVTIPPGVDLARFRPGDRIAARRCAGAAARRRGARVRRPHPAAQGPRRAAARRRRAAAPRPDAARRLVVLVAGGPSGSGLAEPTALQELAAALGIADVLRSCRRRAATRWSRSTGRPTWSPCPATTSRSGWSRWRRRRAAPPWWRRGSAVCRSRWPTAAPACSCPGHGAERVGRRAGRRGAGPSGATSWAAGPSRTPTRSPGTAPPTPCWPPTPAPPTEFAAAAARCCAGMASVTVGRRRDGRGRPRRAGGRPPPPRARASSS